MAFIFPTSHTGSQAPVPSKTSNVLLSDGTTTGSATVASILALIQKNVRVVTASGAVTAALTDDYLVINKTSGAATTVTLVTSPPTGQTISVIDGKGDAGTNNITISPATGTIDGATSVVLQGAYSSVTMSYNGTQWNIIGSTGSSSSSTNTNITTMTTGSSYTMNATDEMIVINKGTGSATTITLIASPTIGRKVTIKDSKGDAFTNNITVTPASGNIDGGSNYVMNINYQSISLVYNGSLWNIV